MRVLTGDERQEYVDRHVEAYVASTLRHRPRSINTGTMDAAIRIPLVEALQRNFVLAAWDGRRITCQYLPEEKENQ